MYRHAVHKLSPVCSHMTVSGAVWSSDSQSHRSAHFISSSEQHTNLHTQDSFKLYLSAYQVLALQ